MTERERFDIIRMAREAGFRAHAARICAAQRGARPTLQRAQVSNKREQTRGRIDDDAVAYHNGAWTSKPPSSRSPRPA